MTIPTTLPQYTADYWMSQNYRHLQRLCRDAELFAAGTHEQLATRYAEHLKHQHWVKQCERDVAPYIAHLQPMIIER